MNVPDANLSPLQDLWRKKIRYVPEAMKVNNW